MWIVCINTSSTLNPQSNTLTAHLFILKWDTGHKQPCINLGWAYLQMSYGELFIPEICRPVLPWTKGIHAQKKSKM